jgi:cell division transport system ATP-binding protein
MPFSNEPIVRDSGVSIYQESQIILSDVNFEMEKAELAFVVGRTGSGKSSLLKTLTLICHFKLGEISIAGFQLHQIKSKEVPMLRRRLGIVFQDFQLLNDRTVGRKSFFCDARYRLDRQVKNEKETCRSAYAGWVWDRWILRCRISFPAVNSNVL